MDAHALAHVPFPPPSSPVYNSSNPVYIPSSPVYTPLKECNIADEDIPTTDVNVKPLVPSQ